MTACVQVTVTESSRSAIRQYTLRIYCIWVVREEIEGKRFIIPKTDLRHFRSCLLRLSQFIATFLILVLVKEFSY